MTGVQGSSDCDGNSRTVVTSLQDNSSRWIRNVCQSGVYGWSEGRERDWREGIYLGEGASGDVRM